MEIDKKAQNTMEDAQQGISKPANTNTSDKPVFDKDGAVGKQFKADGAIGGMAEKVGGPFAKDGAVGKNFNADGALGGTVQENLGKK